MKSKKFFSANMSKLSRNLDNNINFFKSKKKINNIIQKILIKSKKKIHNIVLKMLINLKNTKKNIVLKLLIR